MRHPWRAIALLSLVALGGCTPPEPPAGPVPAASSLTPAPTGVPEQDDGAGPGDPERVRTPITVPTADPDRSGAAVTAVNAMRLFARRTVTPQQWIEELTPHLTTQAALDYSGTDPLEVPATKVTGPGRPIPTNTAWLARIQVPTDDGVWLVILSRTPDDATWRVARFTPPEPAE